ncbi:MAG: hypothetical protein RR232_05960 [Clostridia bacterium]
MRKKTRDYANDYKIVSETAKNGKTKKHTVYTGKYYRYDMPKENLRALKLIYAVCAIGFVALYLAMGFSGSLSLGGDGESATAYVVLPYVILLLPVAMCAAKVAGIICTRGDFEFAQYDKYVLGLRKYSVVLTVSAVACAVGIVIYIIAHSKVSYADIIFSGAALANTALGLFFIRIQDRYDCINT